MPLLSKAGILTAIDRTTKDIEIPEWNGTVRIQSLSGADRDWWSENLGKYRDDQDVMPGGWRAALVARGLIDEQGNRLFTDAEMAELGKKNSEVIERLFNEIQEISAMTDKAKAAIEKK